MNDGMNDTGPMSGTQTSTQPRLPYAPPTLVLYGQVGALTQGASGACKSDNGVCVGPSTNMMST